MLGRAVIIDGDALKRVPHTPGLVNWYFRRAWMRVRLCALFREHQSSAWEDLEAFELGANVNWDGPDEHGEW